MKHLVRAGALLLTVLVILLILPRVMPTPAVIEKYGFYPKQSEENTGEWSGLPVSYADSSVCGDCHQDKHGTWAESKHSTVSCETCHGPGEAHVEKRVDLVVDTSREFCGLCHAKVLARPEDFPQVDVGKHGELEECVTCHNPHAPQTTAPPQVPHSLDGRNVCSSCHSAGGVKPTPQDHAGRTDDTCLNCHQSGQERQ